MQAAGICCALRRGAPAVTGRLCVIGSGLDEEGLRELFKLG